MHLRAGLVDLGWALLEGEDPAGSAPPQGLNSGCPMCVHSRVQAEGRAATWGRLFVLQMSEAQVGKPHPANSFQAFTVFC